MREYVIVADSACDIEEEVLREWGVPVVKLSYIFTDTEELHEDYEVEMKSFYKMMRDGRVAKTSASNTQQYLDLFTELYEQGQDVLYIGFSTGLSTSYNSGCAAAEQLKKKYPERTCVPIDSFAASAGYGLLVYLAVQKKKEGLSLQELAAYVTETRDHLCHWFTVDDLVYLKRGGRISAAAAFVAGVLDIKPVLHVDNEGHLINMFKVRKRRSSIKALADKYDELALHPEEGPIFICQGDCMEDAEYLSKLLLERHNVPVDKIVYTGAVIGAHSGPGTLALFFLGKEK